MLPGNRRVIVVLLLSLGRSKNHQRVQPLPVPPVETAPATSAAEFVELRETILRRSYAAEEPVRQAELGRRS